MRSFLALWETSRKRLIYVTVHPAILWGGLVQATRLGSQHLFWHKLAGKTLLLISLRQKFLFQWWRKSARGSLRRVSPVRKSVVSWVGLIPVWLKSLKIDRAPVVICLLRIELLKPVQHSDSLLHQVSALSRPLCWRLQLAVALLPTDLDYAHLTMNKHRVKHLQRVKQFLWVCFVCFDRSQMLQVFSVCLCFYKVYYVVSIATILLTITHWWSLLRNSSDSSLNLFVDVVSNEFLPLNNLLLFQSHLLGNSFVLSHTANHLINLLPLISHLLR